MSIKLVDDNSISQDDISKLKGWIDTNPRLSKGELTEEFEEKFSSYINTKYSVFVNSGSSANLLMVYALIHSKRLKNNKVIVPAIAWSTTIAPLLQFGLEPIVCDVNLNNLSFNLQQLEILLAQHDPALVFPVNVLGFPADWSSVVGLCAEYGSVIIEDNCESLGSTFLGNKLGQFGLMSSHSFFISHHMCTIEGGMITTNDKGLYNLLKMLRSHGWDRDLNKEDQDILRDSFDVNDFDAMYTFYVPSFNVRSTDLNAFIGLEQLKRLDDIVNARQQNYYNYVNVVENNLFSFKPFNQLDKISNFAFPYVNRNRSEIIKELCKNDIECRPLVCGNIAKQPFLKDKMHCEAKTPIADAIHDWGMYLPNHTGLDKKDIEFICQIIEEVAE